MKIHKDESASTRAATTAAAPSTSPTAPTSQSAEIERILLEEVAGSHASAQRLRAIVERVLGGGEDSDVKALVQKLKKASKADTSGE